MFTGTLALDRKKAVSPMSLLGIAVCILAKPDVPLPKEQTRRKERLFCGGVSFVALQRRKGAQPVNSMDHGILYGQQSNLYGSWSIRRNSWVNCTDYRVHLPHANMSPLALLPLTDPLPFPTADHYSLPCRHQVFLPFTYLREVSICTVCLVHRDPSVHFKMSSWTGFECYWCLGGLSTHF